MNAVDLRNMGLKGLAKEIMGKMENVRLSKWDNRHLTLLLNCILGISSAIIFIKPKCNKSS